MRECFYCHAKIEDQEEYCPQCGQPADVTSIVLEKASRGDYDIQHELYNRTKDMVYEQIREKVSDDAAVMSILQDVYVYALKSLGQLRNPNAFSDWLLMITQDKIAAWQRGTASPAPAAQRPHTPASLRSEESRGDGERSRGRRGTRGKEQPEEEQEPSRVRRVTPAKEEPQEDRIPSRTHRGTGRDSENRDQDQDHPLVRRVTTTPREEPERRTGSRAAQTSWKQAEEQTGPWVPPIQRGPLEESWDEPLVRRVTPEERMAAGSGHTSRTQGPEEESQPSRIRRVTPEEHQTEPETRSARRPNAQVDAILETLPERQRAILSLNYYQNKNLKQIAQTLDLPEETVRMEMAEGKIALQRRILEMEQRQSPQDPDDTKGRWDEGAAGTVSAAPAPKPEHTRARGSDWSAFFTEDEEDLNPAPRDRTVSERRYEPEPARSAPEEDPDERHASYLRSGARVLAQSMARQAKKEEKREDWEDSFDLYREDEDEDQDYTPRRAGRRLAEGVSPEDEEKRIPARRTSGRTSRAYDPEDAYEEDEREEEDGEDWDARHARRWQMFLNVAIGVVAAILAGVIIFTIVRYTGLFRG